MTTPLVFLDTETTGLDPDLHEVWEVAYAVDDGQVVSLIVPHSVITADGDAMQLNGYWRRFPAGALPAAGVHADGILRYVLKGATIVGANPAFDTAFLRRRWGVAPWHYRMVDVESMALQAFGWDRPKGLKSITDAVRALGHEIPEPDHTAAGDVLTTRAVYNALRRIA